MWSRKRAAITGTLILTLCPGSNFAVAASYSECIVSHRPKKIEYLTNLAREQAKSDASLRSATLLALGVIYKDSDFTLGDKVLADKYSIDLDCGKMAQTGEDELDFAWSVNPFQNYALAHEFLEQASALGDFSARTELAEMYAHGYGVPKDLNHALALGTDSATQGVVKAQIIVGSIYAGYGFMFNGDDKGLSPNYLLSYMWFNVAASSGNKDAEGSRDYVSAKLTSEQLSTAQNMSRVCIESSFRTCHERTWWDWIFGR